MSPRRKIQPGDEPLLVESVPKPSRRWGLPLVTMTATLIVATAITVCTLTLVSHEKHRRTTLEDVTVLGYVRSFMTKFTSPDPFHANDYADRVLAQAAGEFAKLYRDKMNDIVIQVGRAERTTGTVLDAGVERWNDDGSVNVLVATKVTSKSPDGKKIYEKTNRWVTTAKLEGDQWKISSLVPVL